MSTTTKKTPTKKAGSVSGFTADERAAMKARAEEMKAEGRRGAKKADEAQACLDAIAKMPEDDRLLAERVHAIVAAQAPELTAKTWYGMPAYANADGKVVCFFKNASKFGARYATLGFNDTAQLDDGNIWPTEYALTRLTATDVTTIEKLVRRACGR